MEAILEWLFQLFGKRTAGQLAGAALVGAFFGAMPFFGAAIFGQEKNLPPIVYLVSIVAGVLSVLLRAYSCCRRDVLW